MSQSSCRTTTRSVTPAASNGGNDSSPCACVEPCEPRLLFGGHSPAPHVLEASPDQALVYAPHKKVRGQTLDELSARWWQWAVSGPADTNPLADLTGEDAGFNQPEGVFFLAGRRGAGTVERTITVPSGSKLFFPVLNVSYITFPTDPEIPASDLRPILNGVVSGYSGLYATVDGQSIDVSGHRHRDPYPDGFSVTLSEGNIYGQPAGVHEPVVSDGYWLLLKPLPVGEHTITFGGQIRTDRRQDITYHIDVVPRRGHSDGDSDGGSDGGSDGKSDGDSDGRTIVRRGRYQAGPVEAQAAVAAAGRPAARRGLDVLGSATDYHVLA